MNQRLVSQNYHPTSYHPRMLLALFFACTIIALVFPSLNTAEAEDRAAITEAYEEIPHRRTAYKADLSTLSRDYSRYLDQMFLLSDRAVIQRVGTLRWFRTAGTSGKTVSSYTSRIRKVLSEFDFLARPRELGPIRDAIVSAIENQHAYFKNSHKEMQKGGAFVLRGKEDPLIGASHQDLEKALKLLQKMFPKEAAHNKQAFVDHLGALDFIQ